MLGLETTIVQEAWSKIGNIESFIIPKSLKN